jgi:hypothetical protein
MLRLLLLSLPYQIVHSCVIIKRTLLTGCALIGLMNKFGAFTVRVSF